MKVKELIELLSKCPQDDIVLADVSEDTNFDIDDVQVGSGTIRGFTFLRAETLGGEE